MKILFASDNYYLPQLSGGTEVSIDALATLLLDENHRVAVSCALGRRGATYLKNRLRNRVTKKTDIYRGYSVYREWDYLESLGRALEEFSPDVVILMKNSQPIIRLIQNNSCPMIVYLGDVYFKDLNINSIDKEKVLFIANSKFTKNTFIKKFGVDCDVAPPVIIPMNYKTEKGNKVLFVNPHPMKGVDLVVSLANNNPDIDFLIVESWPIPVEKINPIKVRLKKLSNVKWLSCQTNMKKVYSMTKLVLMPSQCDEAWGRVASEAQVSGIPIIASNCGGLPESVGPGGILITEPNNLNSWQNSLRRLVDDNSLYQQLSQKAYIYSLRHDIEVKNVLDVFLTNAKSFFSENRRSS